VPASAAKQSRRDGCRTAGPPLRGLLYDSHPLGALQESESQIFMTEGPRSPHRASVATSCRHRPSKHQKNSGPYRCPRGYRGGAAARVRSNTFILRACRLSREGTPRSEPQDRADRDHRDGGAGAHRLPAVWTPPLDISAAAPWKYRAQCRTGVFLLRSAPLRRCAQ
jgi:hypothetical protein